ncbi:hypothetical protein ACFPRL_09530 [Pseudoclavibacter helvolus]
MTWPPLALRRLCHSGGGPRSPNCPWRARPAAGSRLCRTNAATPSFTAALTAS